MFEILKSIHLISLLLAGAASVGNAVLLRRVIAAAAPPPPIVAQAMAALARMGLAAILLLWASGLPLALISGAFASGGALFSVKLLLATLVLGLILIMTWLRAEVAAGRRPPNPGLMRRLTLTVLAMVMTVIILAVVVFH
ncbi:MAG: hypothetical protein WBA91_04100 [Paracoccaceae bacterium]